jgi:hypothetical protein
MKYINKELVATLDAVEGLCLSLYMTTHRTHPDNQQDPIRFKNKIKELEASLLQQYPAAAAKELLQPFHRLVADYKFWEHTLEGLAVLSAGEVFQVFTVPVQVPELTIAANSFHTKPLRKYLQCVDRFQVLGLSLHHFRLYEGNRYLIDEIELPDAFPNTIKEVLGEELTKEHLTVASYGGSGGNKGNMVHGHGGRKDELDKDAERFFRAVAKLVDEQFSKPSGLPLILAALPEHHHLFQSVSKNGLLVAKGVTVNPSSVTDRELLIRTWEVMEPEYRKKIEGLREEYNLAASKNMGTDQLEAVAKAAAEGRVSSLLVEAGRLIPGKLNVADGTIEKEMLDNPEVDDLLDDISVLAESTGANVMVIPAEDMPTQTGLAATFRY